MKQTSFLQPSATQVTLFSLVL